jgi:peptide/nickel transport system substrate-binding protein
MQTNPQRPLSFLLFSLGLAASSFSQSNTERGGELTYGESESVGDLNPYTQTTARGATDRLFALIYEGLVRYDFSRDQMVPWLADSLEVAAGQNRITFHLRSGVRWHDGKPFSANDVKFTFDFIGKQARQQVKQQFDFIASVLAPNKNLVIINFKRPVPDALRAFDNWIIPAHYFSSSFLERQDSVSLSRRAIGTGPYYQAAPKTLDGRVTLNVNENYWGAKGNISKVRMLYFPDPVTLINSAVLGGGVKLVVETPPTAIARLEATNNFKFESYQTFAINVFGYNNANPLLKDPRVRKALTHAVDREQMLKQWYAGKGTVISGPFVPASPYFNPAVRPLRFDPNEAKRLLDAAGYKDGNGDGIRERITDGKPLSFELLIAVESEATSTINQNVAESYASYLRDVGVEIKTVNRTVDDYNIAVFNEHKFEIVSMKWTFDSSYDITDLFESKANYPGGNNILSYNNPGVDKAIKDFQSASDRELRRQIMYKLHETLAEECPYTFLYTIVNSTAIHIQYANTRIDPYYFFTYFPQWYIPSNLRDE